MFLFAVMLSCCREWFAVCEEAMQALFHIHPTPDRVSALVLQHMYAHLDASTSDGEGSNRSVCGIARLLFVLGQTSLCSLVYTEFVAAVAKKYPVKDSSSGASPTGAKSSKKGGKDTQADGKASTGECFCTIFCSVVISCF